jgi:hypothetical protein
MKDDPPGERFQRLYRRRQQESERGGRVLHYLLVVGLVAAGIVLMFIPGPAVVLFGLAGALLAEDSLGIAKALDWTELRGRALVRWARRTWTRAGAAARAAIVLVALGAAGAGAYGLYWFWFGR